MTFDEAAKAEGIAVEREAPLAPLTYFKIGGPAEYLLRPRTNEEFIAAVRLARKSGLPLTIIGGGANVLVADSGIRGIVIHPENRHARRESNMIIAGAGARNGQVLGFSTREGLAGLENLAGVPGTVGGDIYGNAGMMKEGIAPAVSAVQVVDAAGEEKTLLTADCGFAYRTSRFKGTKDAIIEVRFALVPDEPEKISGRVRDLINVHKRGVQPMSEPCSGCVFMNPEGDFAARLIDEAGLKGKRIGGAEVSPLHANFIINTGEATADHVVQLISYIKQQVRDRYGVQLNEEMQYLGFGDLDRKAHS